MNQIERAKAELWRRGILSWKFQAGQKVIEEAYNKVNKKLFIGNCARRFGKSTWAACKALEQAIANPKSKVILATAFQNDLAEIYTPIFQQLLEDCPESILPVFNKTRKKYEFKNGSEITLVGLDKNPNKGRGRSTSLYIIDEAGFCNNLQYVYSSVIVPMTMYNKNARVIIISTPPVSPEHPFKTFVEKAKSEDAYVELTIHQNPMCTLEMIEEYRKECLSETDFLREYECKFVTDENLAIVPEFDASKHVFKGSLRDAFYGYYRTYISFDIGVVDPTFFVGGYYDWKRQQLIIEYESQLQHKDVQTTNIYSVLRTFTDYNNVYRTICDSNNGILVNDLNYQYNLNVIPTSKDEKIAMVSALRIAFKENKIVVHERCTTLINQLMYGVWDKNKKQFQRMNGHHHDGIDALIYLYRNLVEHSNPISSTHGFTENTWNPNLYEEPESTRQIKTIFNIK